jgi:hypothetical protein
MNHKETGHGVGRHKLSCHKETLCPAFKNKNIVDYFFLTAKV